MNGLLKLFLVVLVAVGAWAAWKYIFSTPVAMDSKTSLLSVQEGDWVKGHSDAPVTLIEYADFQCPACGAYFPVIDQLLTEMEGKVKVVMRHYPLIQAHPNALIAARASEAAGRQGKFWEMHALLFKNQREWSGAADPMKAIFPSYAGKIGLSMDQFKKDAADSSIDDKINRDRATGDELGIEGTPMFILNGEKIPNPKTFEDLRLIVEAAVLKAPVQKTEETKEVHEHINLKVYLDGQAVDFSQAKYQSTGDGKDLDEFVHLHDGNGSVVHKHKDGITLGYFLKSLNIDFNKECFQLDGGNRMCTGSGKSLKFYVNGKPSTEFNNYVLHDLDRVLISYGPESDKEIEKQLASVSDDACIYSEACPERGKAPTEECVGGLGSDCKK